MERAEAELRGEEEAKERLCGELNMLVQQSATAQLDKFEQLKSQLDAMYRCVQAALVRDRAGCTNPALPICILRPDG
jgi:hypothetical protein